MSTTTPPSVEVNGFAYREIRIRSGIDPGPCADQAGISRPHLVKIERGQRIRVTPSTFAGLMNALGISDRRAILANPHSDAVDLTTVEATPL
jgi:transcriptional regulator with XRE-family HTH domain